MLKYHFHFNMKDYWITFRKCRPALVVSLVSLSWVLLGKIHEGTLVSHLTFQWQQLHVASLQLGLKPAHRAMEEIMEEVTSTLFTLASYYMETCAKMCHVCDLLCI